MVLMRKLFYSFFVKTTLRNVPDNCIFVEEIVKGLITREIYHQQVFLDKFSFANEKENNLFLASVLVKETLLV